MQAAIFSAQAALSITAQSAWEVLQICDRQARRDAAKVARFTYATYRVLSGPEAVATYRWLWSVAVLAWDFAALLVAIARQWCDAEVERCLEQPSAPVVEDPAPAPEPAVEPAPVVEVVEPDAIAWESMTAVQLRKECQQRAIAWRNANGKGRHLSKAAMIRQLQAA